MRKTVTVPAEGKAKPVNLTGASVIVENSNIYESENDVPVFNFRPGATQNPIYPRSTYVNPEGNFNSLLLEGTAAAEGDEVTFYSVDECLTTELNIIFTSTKKAVAGTSFTVTTTDAAQNLSEPQLANAEGELPASIIVTAQNNPAIYAFDTDPDRTSDLGHILLPAVYTAGSEREVQLLEIEGIDFILKWAFASAISGSAAELTITPRY